MTVYDWLIKNYFVNLSANFACNFKLVRKTLCGTTQRRTRYGLFIKLALASTMKSGQADTCLGNTLNNVWAHLFALAKNNNCSMREMYYRIVMHVLGDDNSTRIPGS